MITRDKLKKVDLSKGGLVKLINRDMEELNTISDRELLSMWLFFKALCIEHKEKVIFMTTPDTIIWKHRDAIEQNTNIEVKLIPAMPAG